MKLAVHGEAQCCCARRQCSDCALSPRARQRIMPGSALLRPNAVPALSLTGVAPDRTAACTRGCRNTIPTGFTRRVPPLCCGWSSWWTAAASTGATGRSSGLKPGRRMPTTMNPGCTSALRQAGRANSDSAASHGEGGRARRKVVGWRARSATTAGRAAGRQRGCRGTGQRWEPGTGTGRGRGGGGRSRGMPGAANGLTLRLAGSGLAAERTNARAATPPVLRRAVMRSAGNQEKKVTRIPCSRHRSCGGPSGTA